MGVTESKMLLESFQPPAWMQTNMAKTKLKVSSQIRRCAPNAAVRGLPNKTLEASTGIFEEPNQYAWPQMLQKSSKKVERPENPSS